MSLHIKPKLSSKLLGSDFSKGSPFGSSRSSFTSSEGYSSHLNFRCVLITFCLAAILYEVCWVISFLVGWISASDQIMTMDPFTSSDHSGNKKDLTNITWAHGVNSKEKLEKALQGPARMLEADVLMGIVTSKKSDSVKEEPIMAHPPNTTSDLSFKEFLSTVIDHNKGVEPQKMKGIKLDFKQIECVRPALQRLHDKKKSINFPVWLNADVLPGPVNATKDPIDGKQFLALAKELLPRATLSLGWTTRYGADDERQANSKGQKKEKITSGQYTKEQLDAMVKLWEESELEGSTVTFPVRAAIASQSVEALATFLTKIGSKSSLTLWCSPDDFEDIAKINTLLDKVGRDRVYCDLPFPYNIDDTDSDAIHVFPDSSTVSPPTQETTTKANNDTDNGKNEGTAANAINRGLTFVSLIATFCFAFL